jgi:hypothetical protein
MNASEHTAMTRFLRWLVAALVRALERLADLAYGPLPEGEKPAPLLGKLGCLAVFGVLVAIGIGSCQLRQREAQAERERERQAEERAHDDNAPEPR